MIRTMPGLCALSMVILLPSGRTNATGNSARRGGAAALHDTVLVVKSGHTLTAQRNAAQLHGGAVALLSGASLELEAAACTDLCQSFRHSRDSIVCDSMCLNSPCNWDNGRCGKVMEAAGAEARQTCDRNSCRQYHQTIRTSFRGCKHACFNAACDWSRELCEEARSNVSSCPLIDAAAYASIKSAQR